MVSSFLCSFSMTFWDQFGSLRKSQKHRLMKAFNHNNCSSQSIIWWFLECIEANLSYISPGINLLMYLTKLSISCSGLRIASFSLTGDEPVEDTESVEPWRLCAKLSDEPCRLLDAMLSVEPCRLWDALSLCELALPCCTSFLEVS